MVLIDDEVLKKVEYHDCQASLTELTADCSVSASFYTSWTVSTSTEIPLLTVTALNVG